MRCLLNTPEFQKCPEPGLDQQTHRHDNNGEDCKDEQCRVLLGELLDRCPDFPHPCLEGLRLDLRGARVSLLNINPLVILLVQYNSSLGLCRADRVLVDALGAALIKLLLGG